MKIDTPNKQELQREFLFTNDDFDTVRKLIYGYAGINLSSTKKDMVYSRLGRRLRATGYKKFSDYILALDNGKGGEWESFVNALTTNLTSFFREAHHFPVLAAHVKQCKQRPIQIWCNAASTGEEPYTIAMTLVDAFDSFTPPVRIIATDIDTQALQKASTGVYTLEQVEKLPKETLQRFFLKGRGKQQGQVKIRDELRALISFSQLNLQDAWPVTGPFDAIFCRNVMIYFDKATQHKILQKFAPIMQPDALLFAGHSESLLDLTDLFKSRGKTVYGLSDKYLQNNVHLQNNMHLKTNAGLTSK